MSRIRHAATVVVLLLAGGAMLATDGMATAADSTPPSTPRDLRVTQATFDTLSLAWGPSRDDSGQLVFYPVFVNGTWTSGSYDTGVTLTGLTQGTTYQVEVFAQDLDGNRSASSGTTAATLSDSQPPTTPANLRTVSGGTALMWDASTDNRGLGRYRLFADGTWIFSPELGIDFWTLVDNCPLLNHGQTYTFTVQATDLTGLTSAPSKPLTVTVP